MDKEKYYREVKGRLADTVAGLVQLKKKQQGSGSLRFIKRIKALKVIQDRLEFILDCAPDVRT